MQKSYQQFFICILLFYIVKCKSMKHIQKTYECEMCQDTGEVDAMEAVYAGEPHMASIGTSRCPDCSSFNDDEYDQDEN